MVLLGENGKKMWTEETLNAAGVEMEEGLPEYCAEHILPLVSQTCTLRMSISDTSPSPVPLILPLSILSAGFRLQGLWWKGNWHYTRDLLRVTGYT